MVSPRDCPTGRARSYIYLEQIYMSANAQQKQPDAADIKDPQGGATTCVVGCKLPHGLKMELWDKKPATDGKGVPVARKIIGTYTAKGNNAKRIIGGYGLTDGIPTSFMVEWLRQNAEHPAVTEGSIFMHSTGEGAMARAKEGRTIVTGLEGIDPIENARKHRLEMESDDVKAYNRQVAENPDRNRQIVE